MPDEKGIKFLTQVGLSYIENIYPDFDTSSISYIFESFIRGERLYEEAKFLLDSAVGRHDALDYVRDILNLKNEPIKSKEDELDPPDNTAARKKTRTWSADEDIRLIGGIYKYGDDNWSKVSEFVGNNRTKAQCAQRWQRGLNPKICKKYWSPDEDAKLIQLVDTYGLKSWTKIASIMGSRSDVQCRYHYKQVIKDNKSRSSLFPLACNRKPPDSFSLTSTCNLSTTPMRSGVYRSAPSFHTFPTYTQEFQDQQRMTPTKIVRSSAYRSDPSFHTVPTYTQEFQDQQLMTPTEIMRSSVYTSDPSLPPIQDMFRNFKINDA